MNDILKTLFWDNPYLPEKVSSFCDSLPGYPEAERAYRHMLEQVERMLGFELFSQFEECITNYGAYEAHAYYLFDLGLRQEILQDILAD